MDPDWEMLPKNLLDLILEKLESSFDYLHFGVVCSRWYSVMKDNQIKRTKILQHHHIPMLLIPGEENTWMLYNTMDYKFSDLKVSIPHNKRFSGFSHGWLVAGNKDYTVTLYNPYVMVNKGNNANFSIHLPCLFPPDLEDNTGSIDYADLSDHHIKKSFLTADPLANPNGCIVLVIFGDMNEVAIFRIAKDTTWSKVDAYDHNLEQIMSNIEEVFLHNNQIYAMDFNGVLMSFDVTNSTNPTGKLIALEIPRRAFGRHEIKRYLVKSHKGELLLIERYLTWRDENEGRETKMFRVFRLDFDQAKWIQIQSLDGAALFLGDNSSISVLASNFIGCQPNSIYFTHDLDDIYTSGQNVMICDVGIYNVKNRAFSLHYNLDSKVLMKMNKRPPIWVVPTLNTY